MKNWQKQNLNITSQKLLIFLCKVPVSSEQTKTEYIVFSTRKRLTNTVLNVDNERIAESNSVKYIGVIIDSKLKFDGEVKKILQRTASEIKVLNTLIKSLPEKRKSYYLMQ